MNPNQTRCFAILEKLVEGAPFARALVQNARRAFGTGDRKAANELLIRARHYCPNTRQGHHILAWDRAREMMVGDYVHHLDDLYDEVIHGREARLVPNPTVLTGCTPVWL